MGKYVKIPALLAALSLFSGCGDKHKPAEAPPGTASALVSAEKTSFDAVTSKLDTGGCVYGYLSTEQWLNGLSGKIDGCREYVDLIPNLKEDDRKTITKVFDVVTNLSKISGVEEISGVGMSSIARQTNLYYNKIVIHHYPGQDKGFIWTLFGKKAHNLDELDLLPEKTALAIFGDGDVPLMWSTIQSEVAKLNLPEVNQQLKQFPVMFEKQTQLKFDDFLGSLGGEFGLLVTLDEDKPVSIPMNGGKTTVSIPTPAIALVAKVKNDMIFKLIDKKMENPMIIKSDKDDVKMRTQAFPLPLPVEVRLTVASSPDYLIFASTDALVKEMFEVKSGKKHGLKTTEEFKQLSQGVPLKGNRFAYTSRLMTTTLAEFEKNTVTQQNAGQQELIKKLFSSSGVKNGFYVSAYSEEGVEDIGNSSDSLSKTVLAPAVAIPVALGVAIPAFMKARETALANGKGGASSAVEYNKIMDQLRQIDGAKQQWALELHKAEGAEVSETDLAPYLNGARIVPVIGEKYSLNVIGKAPTATTPVAIKGHCEAGAVLTVGN